MKAVLLLNLLISLYSVFCRDFYMGMFRKNDYLVAQDNLYKEKRLYASVQADYGRLFKCPITYFRVVDRLGMGAGPKVKVVRGGLQKKYVVVRITSSYNLPISVNIYVGCGNSQPRTSNRPRKATTTASDAAKRTTGEGGANTAPGEGSGEGGANTTPGEGGGEGEANTTPGEGGGEGDTTKSIATPEPGGEAEEPEATPEPAAEK